MLKAIFKSDHFESYAVRYRKVKSPTELVFGVARLTDRFDLPDLVSSQLASHKMFVGQFLLNRLASRVGTRAKSGSTAAH